MKRVGLFVVGVLLLPGCATDSTRVRECRSELRSTSRGQDVWLYYGDSDVCTDCIVLGKGFEDSLLGSSCFRSKSYRFELRQDANLFVKTRLSSESLRILLEEGGEITTLSPNRSVKIGEGDYVLRVIVGRSEIGACGKRSGSNCTHMPTQANFEYDVTLSPAIVLEESITFPLNRTLEFGVREGLQAYLGSIVLDKRSWIKIEVDGSASSESSLQLSQLQEDGTSTPLLESDSVIRTNLEKGVYELNFIPTLDSYDAQLTLFGWKAVFASENERIYAEEMNGPPYEQENELGFRSGMLDHYYQFTPVESIDHLFILHSDEPNGLTYEVDQPRLEPAQLNGPCNPRVARLNDEYTVTVRVLFDESGPVESASYKMLVFPLHEGDEIEATITQHCRSH